MNGAQALVASLTRAGVRAFFSNPGTSELHLLGAVEERAELHSVLCLFEGVATGAADGFGRLAAAPAAALLHQGAGLANGLANLHNARRAGTPVVVLVGTGAAAHDGVEGPLSCDVASLARPISTFVHRCCDPTRLSADALAAVAAASGPPGGVATLLVPSDVAAGPSGPLAAESGATSPAGEVSGAAWPPSEVSGGVEDLLTEEGPHTTLLLGGAALGPVSLTAASRIARATGATVVAEAFPRRLAQGAGRPPIGRLSGDPVTARARLAAACHVVLVDAQPPVAPFPSPGERSLLTPPTAVIHRLGGSGAEAVAALDTLADELATGVPPESSPRASERVIIDPVAPLDAESMAGVVSTVLPADAVVVDESNTYGGPLGAALSGAAPHDLLTVSGFAIGDGMPLAVGAALGAGRPVLCLQGDGSAMYTISALWTLARESLNVTTLILNNGGYSILRREARRQAATRSVVGSASFDLSSPAIDFLALARGMGVPAGRAHTAGELRGLLCRAMAEPGPHLVEAVVPALH